MGVCRILVTGVGGAPGFDLTRSLLQLGSEVVTTDADPLACGLLLPGTTPRLLPSAADPAYTDVLLGLCKELRPQAIISTVEPELPHLARVAGELESLGVRTWLPSSEAIDTCADKAVFHEALTEQGIPTPRTWLHPDEAPDGPLLVVKPRRGWGSKHVHQAVGRAQARALAAPTPDFIVQEHVDGVEFTADCLIDRDGTASVILRYRQLVKNGLSMVAETFTDPAVTALVRETLAATGITGAACAQGFIAHDQSLVMTEVNARVAGGFPLAEAAGAHLVEQLLAATLGGPVDHTRLTYRPGVRLTKYVETLVVAHPGGTAWT
ncbi:ATP-grasp domain-containing protein [Streptomyces avicenniae]|uniref:ATP-grasp domain-containing protein n=1 Tax=Streptomyces avicenniae TaxID=500153 RepID=UPI000699ACBF|nr:ATP-grasp domain-containing protein [Streptomyces avicenniae]